MVKELGGKILEKYDASKLIGLNVILFNCVEEFYDEGDKCIYIPDIEELAYTAAMVRCLNKKSFNGDEIRNIRKIIGWSAKKMEEKLKISYETISRWENDKYSMGGFVEKLFRISVCEELKEKCNNVDYSPKDITYMNIQKQTSKVYLMFSRVKIKINKNPIKIAWEPSLSEAA